MAFESERKKLGELSEENKKGFRKLGRFFRKPKVEIERIELKNRKAFYNCKVETRKGKIPWEEIEAVSPAKTFLVPDCISEKPPFVVWQPKKLPQLMLFNSAVEYIRERALPPTKTQITIVDKEGRYVALLKNMINLASQITVITNDERYRKLSQELLNDYGVSLIIREEFCGEKVENGFLFDCSGESAPLSYKGTVFSSEKKYLLNGKSLTPGGFDLPDEYEKLRILKINKLHFASALFELCDVKELQSLKFNELCS